MLERGKATGPDGIMNEVLIYGGGWLVGVMLLMMSECCPLDWKRSLLVPLPKDDVEQVGNYRGITLGCSVVKVLARRLGGFAEDRILTEVQGRFRSGRRCSDQWLVLRGVHEGRGREKKNLSGLPGY